MAPDLHFDDVPLPVLLSAVVVADVVLLAQFVGEALCRIPEITEAAHDFRAPARVVGDRTKRILIHMLVARSSPDAPDGRKPDLRRKRKAGKPAAAARQRKWKPRTARLPRL